MLILIPEKVNGTPRTIKTFDTLLKTASGGKIYYYQTERSDLILSQHGDTPIKRSYWVLITKKPIPENRGTKKSIAQLEKAMKGHILEKAELVGTYGR